VLNLTVLVAITSLACILHSAVYFVFVCCLCVLFGIFFHL